jgi:carboxyl-terminal processing protease
MIPTTNYKVTQDVNQETLNKLQAAFLFRLKTKPELIKLKEDFERWKKLKEQNSIALQLEKRKKELDEQKKKPDESLAVMDALASANSVETLITSDKKEVKKEDKPKDKHAKDAYLKEAEQIMIDFIAGPKKIAKVVK